MLTNEARTIAVKSNASGRRSRGRSRSRFPRVSLIGPWMGPRSTVWRMRAYVQSGRTPFIHHGRWEIESG
eukprot:11160127-Lingulodinium_polyedra.AAC.1